jgi:hypothetical protein
MFWHYAGHVLQFFIQSRKRKRKKSLDFKHIPITGVIPFLLNIRLGMNLKDYLSSLNSMIHYPLTPEKIKRPTNVIMAQRDFLMKNKRVYEELSKIKKVFLSNVDTDHMAELKKVSVKQQVASKLFDKRFASFA